MGDELEGEAKALELNALKLKIRSTARQLWREYPTLSFEEMAEQYDIKNLTWGCVDIGKNDVLDWITPELSAEDEMQILRGQRLWTVGDAAAIWLDLNPFVFSQAFHQRNPSFFNMPIFPGLRDSWMKLHNQAVEAAMLGELQSIRVEENVWVTPRAFYEWGMANTEGPIGWRPSRFFGELKMSWEKEEQKAQSEEPKPPSKVELKRIEINRIIELIVSIDPEFDHLNMPGRREDFHNLCIQVNKKMFSVAPETFNDYLGGLCKFNAGARETDYYSRMVSQLG